MNDLIERLERATGPDRELDADIQRTIKVTTIPLHVLGTPISGHPEWVGGPSSNAHWLAFYTASIDAALTLVPDGAGWGWCVCAYEAEVGAYRSGGATHAIALCIAALKARAALNPDKRT